MLTESTNNKAILFLEGIEELKEKIQSFTTNPSMDKYKEVGSLYDDMQLYIMGVMGFDPYIKMEAVELLESTVDFSALGLLLN